jgi:endonuclease-3 related protein
MRGRFGHQRWWPAETPFEVCVGAILTQNTSWTNVERAIARLKAARVLEPARLFALPESKLAGLIRSAGYFNVKARRLRSFLRVLIEDFGGDLKRLFAGETATVRARLLAINGIGPETADCLLLYAGGHHSFVIDAYTRRIFQRHEWSPKSTRLRSATARQAVQNPKSSANYDELKMFCESALNQKNGAARLDYWQDYHAQLVMVGKHFCRPRASRCEQCPLKPLLP